MIRTSPLPVGLFGIEYVVYSDYVVIMDNIIYCQYMEGFTLRPQFFSSNMAILHY